MPPIETVLKSFTPTPASIPPPNPVYRLALPPNVRVNHTPLTPVHFLLKTASIHPEKIALAHPDTDKPVAYRYGEMAQRAQNLAYALIERGIEPGDRVAIICPNAPMIIEAHYGVPAAQAVMCLINTRLRHSEVAYILKHSGSKLIICDHEYLHLVEGTKLPVIVSKDSGREGDPYEDLLTSGRRFSRERGWPGLKMVDDEEVAISLCYTSGTTGRPKGVVTTHRGSYLAAIANAFESHLVYDSVYLWLLPAFHAAGWCYPWAVTFAFATHLTTRTVDNKKIWEHLQHSGVSHYCGAPTVSLGIVSSRPVGARPAKKVLVTTAASAPTAALIEQLELAGLEFLHVYGATETYGPITKRYPKPDWVSLDLKERARLLARQGHGFATTEDVRVVYQAEEGKEEEERELIDVPMDGKTIGEIVMRGNIVMKEYHDNPEATRKAFIGGWYHSGDLAVRYPSGEVSIQDRSKDLIISGGENISTLLIELEISAHPDVGEVAAVARPHAKWGERPMAFVILKQSAVGKWAGKDEAFSKDLKTFLKTNLPGFGIPEWIQIVQELPKSSTGKIQKNELRAIARKLSEEDAKVEAGKVLAKL